jgi:hypothetical protein
MTDDLLPPPPPAPETVNAFMSRMWAQDMRTLAEKDWTTLMVIAMTGAQTMIAAAGPDVPVPS